MAVSVAVRRTRKKREDASWSAGEERDRKRVHSELRTVYFVLGTIILLSVIASLFFSDDIVWVERFGPGVATDSFGILLTLVFVHRFLERQERSRRLRGSIGALRRGSRALAEMADAWAELLKGTLPRVPGDPVHTVLDLFAPHFIETITYADPRSVRMSPGVDPEPWVRWTARRVGLARTALNDIIVAYSGSLDPGYVEAIDEIVDDPFLGLFHQLAEDGTDAREWRVRLNAARAARDTYFGRLIAAIRLHNELARDAATVRSRRIAPRTGTVGMELPLDHDLRVELDMPRRWWTAEPGVGSIRSDLDRASS